MKNGIKTTQGNSIHIFIIFKCVAHVQDVSVIHSVCRSAGNTGTIQEKTINVGQKIAMDKFKIYL